MSALHIAALAGGVGGAKLAEGLAQILPPDHLTVIVNIGDDFEHFGLRICPDLDTVSYTLAGMVNPVSGWGRADESFQALDNVRKLGGEDWFLLGDKDLGTHLERTRRLRRGEALSRITRDFCHAWGIQQTILPVSDDPVPTLVHTDEGELAFQEYFVHRRCAPRVQGFTFQNVEQARPAEGVLEAIQTADAVVICPSNPWVSIDPILAVPGIRRAVQKKPVVAVSPLIGGEAVKGPAAKMYAELGIVPSALAVARHYGELLSGFIFDQIDRAQEDDLRALGIQTLSTQTLMKTAEDRRSLGQDVLNLVKILIHESDL